MRNFPPRHNIVLIADEAHRSQYGLKAKVVVKSAKSEKKVSYLNPQTKPQVKVAESTNTYKFDIQTENKLESADIKYGYAKYLRDAIPNASFVGFTGTPIAQTERVSIIPAALNHILGLADGKQRYIKAVGELSTAFALVSSTDDAITIRDEVGFFQAIKAAMVKYTTVDGKSSEDIDAAVRQIVSKAIASEQVIDIFASAGLNKPNIAILSDEFLEEVRGLPYRNVALETLQKLINEAIKISFRKNLILARSFREMLENTIKRYQNRAIETAQLTYSPT